MPKAAQQRNRTVVRIDSLPEIQVGDEMVGIIRKATEKALQLTLQEKSSQGFEVSIFLTDDAEIHRLNKLYRDVDRPTDVLAFAMREGVDGELNREILGDVVISIPRAEQQASIYGHSLEVEISLLVSHGVLHLLGYEHEEGDAILVMQQKQREILHSLGCHLTENLTQEPANGAER